MAAVLETSVLYSNLLPWEVRGLGAIFDDAKEVKNPSEFFSIVCRDFVGFIKKSSFLAPLRKEWEEAITKCLLLGRRLKKSICNEPSSMYIKTCRRRIAIALYLNTLGEP